MVSANFFRVEAFGIPGEPCGSRLYNSREGAEKHVEELVRLGASSAHFGIMETDAAGRAVTLKLFEQDPNNGLFLRLRN